MFKEENRNPVFPSRSDLISLRESLFDIKENRKESSDGTKYFTPLVDCVKYFQENHNIPIFVAKCWISILRGGKLIDMKKDDGIWCVVLIKKR